VSKRKATNGHHIIEVQDFNPPIKLDVRKSFESSRGRCAEDISPSFSALFFSPLAFVTLAFSPLACSPHRLGPALGAVLALQQLHTEPKGQRQGLRFETDRFRCSGNCERQSLQCQSRHERKQVSPLVPVTRSEDRTLDVRR
jgi:hypothetical protein